MSLIRRALATPLLEEQREATLQSLLDDLGVRRSSTTGLPVSPDSAMRLVAVWASVNQIADTVSAFPVDEYRRQGSRLRPVDTSPLFVTPAPGLDVSDWVRQILVSLLLRGNAWGIILERSGPLMYPSQVEIVWPDDVMVSRVGKLGRLVVRFNGQELGPDEYWHCPAYLVPGSPVGLSPIRYAAETIGTGLAANAYGGSWFNDSAHPSAVLSSDADITREQAQVVKERWMDAIHGKREPAVLGGSWKYQAVQISPEESQFLETIQANGALIATFFGLRPEDIGFKSGDSMTYANVEQRQIARLMYPLNQWVVRLERHLSNLLPRGRVVRFNTDASIRPDLKTRTEVQALRVSAGLTSVNEERDLLDMDPIPDGDRFNWPPRSTAAPKEGGAATEGESNAP